VKDGIFLWMIFLLKNLGIKMEDVRHKKMGGGSLPKSVKIASIVALLIFLEEEY